MLNSFSFHALRLQNSTPISTKTSLHGLDIALLVIYLVLVLGLGLSMWVYQIVCKNSRSTNHFFTGGGKNPVVVVGLSMWATILSSLFFTTASGQAAESAWMWSGANIALIGITPFVAIWIIPFYRRLKESTAYAYLEKRFHYSLRALNSLSFIVFQIFRTAVVLFVPISVLTAIVDVSPYLMIIIVGLVIIGITALGGFKAVIWTDAMQGLILLAGIFSVVIAALAKTNWGAASTSLQPVLPLPAWKVSAAQGGIALIFTYNIINSMYAFMGSQDVTQRYKGTRNIYEIRKTMYITSFLGVLTILIFFGSGAALYTYYSSQGTPVHLFPAKGTKPFQDIVLGATGIKGGVQATNFMMNFVATALPVGFVGFILAAIFAASQSTVSSGLSALANSIVTDFIQRFNVNKNGRQIISDFWLSIISRLIVVFFGSLAIAFGCVLVFVKQDKLFNYFTGIVGLLNAPTVAVFVLGVFTVRANWIGTLIGMICGVILGIPLWILGQNFIPKEHQILFIGVFLTFSSFFTTLIVGYFASLFINYFFHFKQDSKFLTNRTMLTRSKEFKELTRLETEIGKFQVWFKKGKISKSYLDMAEARMLELEKIVDEQY